MKNRDLFTMTGIIEKFKNIKGAKFAYCLAKNKKIILDELEVIKGSFSKLNEEDQKLNVELEGKRKKLVEEYCEKDENGECKVVDKSYDLTPENRDKFETEYSEILKEYDDMLKTKEELIKSNEELLDVKSEIKFYNIKLDDLPDELSLKDVEPIMDFIID